MGNSWRICWLTARNSQAEENPGFLDTLLTILENEANPGIRVAGMQISVLSITIPAKELGRGIELWEN